MQTKNFNEEKFDSFLNKTIIYSSKWYYRTQMKVANNENLIVDDENSSSLLRDFYLNDRRSLEKIDNIIDLSNAFNKLSANEQAVIFLLFKKDLKQEDVADILKIYSRSVRRIEYRALKKLKKFLKGDV